MKFLTKTVYEGGSLLHLSPDAGEQIPDCGKERINIYPVERQKILGFGGAFTESAAFAYSCLDEDGKKKAMELLFGKTGLRYNFCRLCIGSSDFSLDMYDYIEESDETLGSFSVDRDRKYVIPMVRDAIKTARDAGEEIVFIASPWSPPAFMKDNKSRVQGHLLPKYRELYAEYIARFVEEYKKEGIKIFAVTPQNEPLAGSLWDSCLESAEEETELIKALSGAFMAHGLDTKILGWDHNKGRLYHRMEKVYKKVGNLVAGAAFHWYSGQHFEELALLRELYPDKLLVASEFCNGLGRTVFDSYGSELIGNFTHGVQAECEWNLMLDKDGGPYHDREFGCSAPLMSEGNGITLRRSYYETYIFSHFIKRGARALATSSYRSDLTAAAFRNPDEKIVVIVRNPSAESISYNLSVFNRLYKVTVPPESMTAYEIAE